MLWRSPRRLVSVFRFAVLRYLPVWRWVLLVFSVWTCLECLYIHHYLYLAEQTHRVQLKPKSPVRVYIASIHWNNERILRESWNQAFLDLVSALGPKNVFVSVYESGSRDGSKDALLELDKALEVMGAPRNVTLDNATHADAIASPPSEPGNGCVKTSRGQMELRRIPYLARLRNISLQPLKDMALGGTAFDYVLFLNDVVFTVADVFALLDTNNGEYAAACSLDYSRPPQFYDTFALRDTSGHECATQTWPYFRSSKSRKALKQGKPVPVSACWNGMVSMHAATFVGGQAIAFRGLDDALATKYVEGSECCLIHIDNPQSAKQGVYVNPYVRVGYSSRAYESVHPDGSWLTYTDIFTGLWTNRLARWYTMPWFKEWRIRRSILTWEMEVPGRKEDGMICTINEMQVLVENGWAHV